MDTHNFFLYIRVSTEEQDPLAQRLEAEKFIRDHPTYRIVRVYEERASAWSQAPTELVRLIKDIAAIPVPPGMPAPRVRPHLMVKSVDRFSRNIAYGQECLQVLLNQGVDILFFDTPNLNVRTPGGKAEFDKLLASAQGYSDLQSAKIKDALAVRKENGLATTKIPVFGTDHEELADGRKYVIENPQEVMVQGIIAMLNGNYTNDQLMRAVRVYQMTHFKETCNRSMYDCNFVDFNDRHQLYRGTDKTFSEILNYFKIFKRGQRWTSSQTNYQWNKYIKPRWQLFENYIERNLLCHPVPEHLLIPNHEVETGIVIVDDDSSESDCDSSECSSSNSDSSTSEYESPFSVESIARII